jgi:hypothetical protein
MPRVAESSDEPSRAAAQWKSAAALKPMPMYRSSNFIVCSMPAVMLDSASIGQLRFAPVTRPKKVVVQVLRRQAWATRFSRGPIGAATRQQRSSFSLTGDSLCLVRA